SWLNTALQGHQTNARPTRGTYRPELELLEVRITPADRYLWAGPQDGLWSVGSNWRNTATDALMPADFQPTQQDILVFSGADSSPSKLDPELSPNNPNNPNNAPARVDGILILPGYTGTITLEKALTVSSFRQESGNIGGPFAITID